MNRGLEYLAVCLLGAMLVFFLVEPIITETAASITRSAELISNAS